MMIISKGIIIATVKSVIGACVLHSPTPPSVCTEAV